MELENNETILVFANQVNSNQWNNLQVNNTYQFTVKEGKNDSNILVSYLFGNVQEWLDREYPRKGWINEYDEREYRSEAQEIYLNEPSLEGELDLWDFIYSDYYDGVRIYISLSVDENKLTFKNKRENAKIIKLVQAQEYINQEYPIPESRKQITELNIIQKYLEGTLDLSDFTNLNELNCKYNKLTFLNLSNCSQLEAIDCSYNLLTNLILPTNPTDLKYLDLWNNNFPEQEKKSVCGWCWKCQQSNTSWRWCQPCAKKEWQQDLENLTGLELVEKFIRKQQLRGRGHTNQLQWIPYEKFTNIKYLASGGFSQIYSAEWKGGRWGDKDEEVVLKSLNNSQNITLEFLQEIANTELLDNTLNIVPCYGISQDLNTGNYVMVMDYKKDGDLRKFLENNYCELSLENKLERLLTIAGGLSAIHEQNLIHRDLHSGNILNDWWERFSCITDLGLSCLVNFQKKDGEIFGVLPYVAPEVLRGNSYTQKSDIYSFGIIAYELLANEYPYLGNEHDISLSLEVCSGLRPDIDKVPLPQEVKDLIKRCWDANPEQRPSADELSKMSNIYHYNSYDETSKRKYNSFSQNTPYQIHPTATTTSRMIDTNEINRQLQSECLDCQIPDTTELNQAQNNWTNIHSSFTDEIVQQWQSLGFTYEKTQEWINIGLQPTDYNFCAWLRNTKHLTPEQVLNKGNLEQLNQEFFTWWQEQQSNIEIPPK